MTSNNLKTPFFSIAVPAYEMNGNGVDFLNHSFSILDEQTFTDFEVVVSDHSLNDDIKDLCNTWSNRLNIKYLQNSYRRGESSPNINNAIKSCGGKWIKFLFQDDFLYNSYSLENLKTHITNNDNNFWFATACDHSYDGNVMIQPHYPVWTKDIHLGNNRIGAPSNITIKNRDVLYFNEDLIWLMDVEYYKRMYDKYGEPSYFQSMNVVNRLRNDGLTTTLSQEIKEKEVTLMQNKYKNLKTKNMEFKDSIGIFKNAFTKEECKRLINSHSEAIKNGTAYTGKGGNKKSTDYNIVVGESEEDQNLTNIVAGKFNSFNLEYLKNFCSGNEYDATSVVIGQTYYPLFQIQHYKKNEGHFSQWHIENYGPEVKDRLFVFILYLNDVKEGGETEFYFKENGSDEYFGVTPEAGTLIIHPASWPYVHRGCMPKSDDKYILTSWGCYNS